MGSKYDYEYGQFNDKYHLDINVAQKYENLKKLSMLDAFNFSSDPRKAEEKLYVDLLAITISEYFNGKVKMEAGKTYDTSDVSIVGFVEGIDDLVHAIRSDEAIDRGKTYTHTRYGGVDLDLLLGSVWDRIKHFNQPLPDIWAHQIRKGTISFEQLQSATNVADSNLKHVKKETYVPTLSDKYLGDVIMARKAMEIAIHNRSFASYLNPANWCKYRRETNYLNDLNRKLNAYEENGLPVNSVTPAGYKTKMFTRQL